MESDQRWVLVVLLELQSDSVGGGGRVDQLQEVAAQADESPFGADLFQFS
jgi:hypothetical protein